MAFRIKNIREEPSADDGVRVLADRLWPRGISKDRAALDQWAKEVTPSDALRQEFHAGLDRATFEARYRAELEAVDLAPLRRAAQEGTVTLLTAVKEPASSHLAVLHAVLEGH